jgi:bud emergence protein 1
MKGDKTDSKPHHISIPPKDAIAIVPPKKVSLLVASLLPRQAPQSALRLVNMC